MITKTAPATIAPGMQVAPSFDRHGAADPVSPVILSVPHAGRDYPQALLSAIRVPLSALLVLEDRHVDALALAARGEEICLVQRRARAWIDLNRAEHERDPKLDDGADPVATAAPSAKLRSGLGLVPRRVSGAGDIWRRRLSAADVAARIAADHRPYHHAVGIALAAARARFGIAVLLDVHSMPPLGDDRDAKGSAARIVVGDRFGKSSAARFVSRIEAEVQASGIALAVNSPYSGGHILDRHAAPSAGIHAVQIEFDRTLYLDTALRAPGPGLGTMAALLRRMIDAVADEALAMPIAIAAE